MNFEEFKKKAETYNIIPVFEKMTADTLTPVLAYLRIREKGVTSFLLESVEGIGRLARYSFIAKNPKSIITNYNNTLKISGDKNHDNDSRSIFEYLKETIKNYKYAKVEELPDFAGGIVGYFGFETIALIEDVIKFSNEDKLEIPDSEFGLFSSIIAFDHFKHQIILINNVFINNTSPLEEQYSKAKEELKILRKELTTNKESISGFKVNLKHDEDSDFTKLVAKAKKNIYDGDVFQIVLSKRFDADFDGDLINVYRALRIINPSPYMYFMEFDNNFSIIGTSPEDLLKVKNRKAEILPIAGTRRRGRTEEEDLALEKNLLDDPKEIAEHTMLVDLARNDLGRVCKYGTVKISEKMKINRFSHVMHIVSRVEGILDDDKDCIDALTNSFPAGTVTGAPKIRAIQLINEYENISRNVYAGAIGYIDFSGNLDLCIAIRTLFAKDNKIYWQAGAGIVADSVPELELKEINNKSSVLVSALKYAEVIDEDIDNR
jgi:anthranilate synthase component 1